MTKARLDFDQASPTCDCHVWNRPGFGAVDVMHVFREPLYWVRPLVGLYGAPILTIHPLARTTNRRSQ